MQDFNFTENEVIIVLTKLLGSRKYKNLGSTIRFQSVCHNSSGLSLSYFKNTNSFYCWSECGNFNNLVSLTSHCLKLSYFDSLNKLETILNRNLGNNTEIEDISGFFNETENLDIFKPIEEQSFEINFNNYNENILKTFYSYHPSVWTKDHIKPKSTTFFGIKVDIENQRIIIPQREINGSLQGIRFRNYKKELDIKYMPLYNYECSLSQYLYGLYENFFLNKKKRPIIVVFESEKSVFQLHSYYELNSTAVALGGSSFSEFQAHRLLELDPEEVVIALDKEYTNEIEIINYIKKIDKVFNTKLKNFTKVSYIVDYNNVLPLKASPSDLGKEIYEKLYKEKIYFE